MTSNEPSSVLILGANGRLGLATARAFSAAGWRVLAALRHAPAPGMPAGVQVLRTPLTQTRALAEQARDVDVVVHAVSPPYAQWQRLLLPAARAGMDLAQQLGARFLLPGNVYNFGETMPARLLEDTPQVATGHKGRLRIALEDELQRRCAAGDLQAAVVRAGDFYGAGTGNWFDLAIVKSLMARRLVYPGPLDVPHAWAYLPDLARTFVAVAQHPVRDGARLERFHFSGHTLTGAELLSGIEAAATSLGLAAPGGWARGSFPWGLLRIGGVLVPTWRELTQMRYLWTVPHALAGDALQRAVGPTASTAPAQALRATLVDLGFGRGTGAPAVVAG